MALLDPFNRNHLGKNVGRQIRNTKQKRPHETLLLVIRNWKLKNLIGTFAPPSGTEDVGRHNEMLVNKFRLGLELLTLGLWPCGKQFTGQSPQQLNIHPYGSSCPSKARVGKINIYLIFCFKKKGWIKSFLLQAQSRQTCLSFFVLLNYLIMVTGALRHDRTISDSGALHLAAFYP